ncbi:nuclear GTPase SLIP-GC-like isoform X2 [Pseudorasbora parva]
MNEQTEQPVISKNQKSNPVPSQSALSGISFDGSLAQNVQPSIVSQGIKRKRGSGDSHTSAKSHSDWGKTILSILRMAKQIMTEVKIRIQNIYSSNQTTTELMTNILDAITTMDKMDKDKRRNETTGVFGKTGEGKSSLLNAILGLEYLLPSGSYGACTAIVTQVEANLTDSNYIAEIELISKQQWEDEIASTDKRTQTVRERITAVYGKHTEKKTLEELKKDDKHAEIENILSTTKKTISNTDVIEFANDVARHIQNSDSSPGGWYWPLVKSVKIKIPNCEELLEHIVLVDIPGTGDCNKIRDDMWKNKLKECSSVWIASGIKRAITESDPWGILNHCIQDLGPGGECKNINFICTRTDEIDPEEYIRSVRLSKDQLSSNKTLKTGCILHRNKCAKEHMKGAFADLENMKLKDRFITDVFTVSSKAYLDKNPHLETTETEIPKLQDVLKNTNRRINLEITRDYINQAMGVLSFIKSLQLETDENMAEIKTVVHKDLEENLEKALNELNHNFDSPTRILDQCLLKGAEESVELCVATAKSSIDFVAPDDKRGFHKSLQAMYKNKGYHWPKNWNAPLDLNMILAKHMHDNIDTEFNSIFPVDVNIKTGISVQEQIDKFSIIQSCTVYPPSSMLYHMENFIKTEETRVKSMLKREVVSRKKKIYSSIQTTIQNQMTPGYEQAAKFKGKQAMKKREKIIEDTIKSLKGNMFKDAQMEALNEFELLKRYIWKTLESELKESVERSHSQTSTTPLMDVSREIEKLDLLSKQLSD